MWNRRHWLGVVAFLSFTTVAWLIYNSLLKSKAYSPSAASPGAVPTPERSFSAESYNEARAQIEAKRVSLLSSLTKAENSTQKSVVLDQAREALAHTAYSEIFEHWYGTPWDFNGTTEAPGRGKIACGYFVTTVLRDLGLKVERAKLAQQASENIILSLTTNPHIKRYRRTPMKDFVEEVRTWGPGLFIVGLDVHVGFIMNVDDEVYFIHSSYIDPFCVVKERAIESKILASSKYRVLGKITADDEFVLKWLRGDQFTTRVG